jgi:uncharacterized protein YjiS (DUF1127 family)
MPAPENSSLKVLVTTATLLGIFFLLAGLIWVMYYYTQPEPPDYARWAERKRNLTELNAHNRELLENYGWIDEKRGLVRLPINRAVELTVNEWQNPRQARAAMLARLDKIAPPPLSTNAPAPSR